jgi:ML domain
MMTLLIALWMRIPCRHRYGHFAETLPNTYSFRSVLSFVETYCSDKNGVTIEPTQPLVGENITVTVKGTILKRVTSGKIDVDLRLMKFIKITPTFDLCEQLDGELFQESNVSCPLEEGKVTLIAKKLIPEDVPKVRVNGNITLTNQDGETLTCNSLFALRLLFGIFADDRCVY